MKNRAYKILLPIVAVCITAAGFSQNKAPYDMMVDGVKIIVQPSGNGIVQVQAVLKGGVQNYPAAKAGIESLAIDALTECGTTNDDKNSFKNKLDKVSGRVYGKAAKDFSSLSLNCLKEDFDAAWALYADALTKPAFDPREFERIKQDAITNVRQEASDPTSSIETMAQKVAFAGLDYAKNPEGTETSLKALTVAETKDYYKKLAVKSRMVIVVVADIDRQDLEQKILNLLAEVPAGQPFAFKKEAFAPKVNVFKAEKKELATNYIQAVAAAPAPGTKDYNAFILAMRIFSNKQFLEVRTNNGLSYAPYSFFDGGLTPSANIFVSTTQPDKYKMVMDKLIAKTKTGFAEDDVKNMKTTYLTQQYYRQETNEAQAASLAANEVLHNNWRRSLTISDDLKSVTAKDVTAAFGKYVNNLVWVYQGDPSKATPALFTQGAPPKKLPPSSLTKKKAQ